MYSLIIYLKNAISFSPPPEITISLLWTTVFPLTAYLTHCKTASSLSYPYDVAIGAYMFCTLILIKALFTNYLSLVYKKIFAVFYIILQLFLFCIPISNILYYALFDAPIDSTSMMVLMQTNISEAIEYISSIPILIVITGIIIILSFLYILYRFNFKNIFSINIPTLGKRKLYFCFLLLPIGIYYTFFSLFPRTAIIKTAIDTNSYFNSTQIYKTARHNILQNLHVEKNISTDKPHTIILVIGESANRDYMHAFNSNLDNTTPWLSSHRNDFLLYSNAYSCAWNTVPALEHALTEANYYNNKPFNQSVSIIDIAKEAGYKTYWYSNQGKIGIYDTPISLVAETADISHWGTTDTPHDLGLLPYLKNINKNENNHYLTMAGQDVFKFAVKVIPESIDAVLEKTSLTLDDIKYVVCHQANYRIIRNVYKKMKSTEEKFYMNLQEYGNTSAASIPLALGEMNEKGMLNPGDKIICVGFGGGLTWGATLIEWS